MAEAYTNPQMEEEEEGIEIPVEFEQDGQEAEAEKKGEEPAKQDEQEPKQEEAQTEDVEEAQEEEEAQAGEASEEGDITEESQAESEKKDGAEAEAEPEKKGFFGRRKKDKEKEKLEQQVGELTDRLKRSMAEFDNFRKRTEKEKSSMYAIGAKDVVEKILPVVDSFERGLAGKEDGDPFVDGMKMIYRQMLTALEEAGVKPIEAVGQPFDTNLHNAVMHVDDESVGENIVVEEFQKGYKYKDSVVRHSMVKVAN